MEMLGFFFQTRVNDETCHIYFLSMTFCISDVEKLQFVSSVGGVPAESPPPAALRDSHCLTWS